MLSDTEINSTEKDDSQFLISTDSLYTIEKTEEVKKFERSVVLCVLNECMNQLSILRSINVQNDLGTNPRKLVSYLSIENRYMGQENHAECRINSTNSNFDKLAKDINMLYVIFKETCREIRKNGNFKTLEDSIKIIRQMHNEEEQLLQDEQNYERVIEDLKSLCEEERLENIRTIEETNAKIQKLKFDVEDIYIYGQHEVSYFDKWEKTRVEQNEMKCKEKENNYTSIIKEMERKSELENRCHSELVSYLEESKNDYLDEIQYWMKRYDEETEQREGDMIHLRADLEKITEERKLLQGTFNERQAAIKDWLEYKRIKEEKEIQRLKELGATVRIQAWWRGVMVRKKLGPYKIKKKGKSKGKGVGKDKKKEK